MSVARTKAAAIDAYGLLFVIGGSNGAETLDSMEILDPTTGEWTMGKQMFRPRMDHCVARYKDAIYAVGGLTTDGEMAPNIDVYNMTIQQWANKVLKML